MQKFINQIRKSVPDSQVEISDLENFCTVKSLQKNEILLEMRAVCNYYYFVNQGALRFFYFDEKGEEHTSWVAFENYFFTELESYSQKISSQYTVIATEETEVLQIHRSDMDLLFEKYDWWRKYLFFNQEETILNLIKVIQSFQTLSAKDRYEELFDFPDFIKKIKQKDLASMLGMSKYAISRLKK
ncbi:MAG: Crp/Fnr family transcriptional regulator [Capnocytophaga sp.]|nr:Crp/Fnr family transcriptional regulator [Capnocytophaga sp.]